MELVRRRGLYAIIDPDHCEGRDPTQLATAVLAGGCAVLQLRSKMLSDAAYLALARTLRRHCTEARVPFVVNDRADLAWLAGSDGLHLGQEDLPLAEARRVVGETVAIGLSTHDEAQAQAAVAAGADLIGFGPVFETRTKERPDPVVGLARLGALARTHPLPIVAIGGITVERARAAAAAGAQLVAVISALAKAADPERTARELHLAAGGTT